MPKCAGQDPLAQAKIHPDFLAAPSLDEPIATRTMEVWGRHIVVVDAEQLVNRSAYIVFEEIFQSFNCVLKLWLGVG